MGKVERVLRAAFWRVLAARCDHIMRTVHGQSGCANPREHREPFRG